MLQQGVRIQAAIMPDEWSVLVAQIKRMRGVLAYAQIDVMDGVLVPSKSFPYNQSSLTGKEIPEAEDINFEAHLMVRDPLEVGLEFIKAGCRRIVAQVEGFLGDEQAQPKELTLTEDEVRTALVAWREAGAEQVGLSIMLDTPLDTLTPFLDRKEIDMVQIMSIARVGYQGEAFDDRVLTRIRALRTRYPHVIIEVDGGVNEETIADVALAGAHVASVGSALVASDDVSKAYEALTRASEL